ncbi:MAG: glycine cleavage system aminomethyltransferase GcvT [bacterium]
MASKTALHDEHVHLGAKIVEFAGYLMPVQYSGILQEHRRVRSTVGLFDVSHMGEFIIRGPGAGAFLQNMTINNVSKLALGQAQYSAMCYQNGGIVDDLLLYRLEDHYLMVVNASNIEKDWNWLAQHKPADVEMENVSDETTLLAVQGPQARALLWRLTSCDLEAIAYYHFVQDKIDNKPMIISRTGYTGEVGFELYMENQYAAQLWNAILQAGKDFDIGPVGLGARDTLRLEMKYCLYGNDIDQTTSPLEADLGWITKLKKGQFIGRDSLLEAKQEGVKRKLVGFVMENRALPRNGYRIFQEGMAVGEVTSGTLSPSLNIGIGLGYVPIELSDIGTKLDIQIRNKSEPATIVETPFYKAPSAN